MQNPSPSAQCEVHEEPLQATADVQSTVHLTGEPATFDAQVAARMLMKDDWSLRRVLVVAPTGDAVVCRLPAEHYSRNLQVAVLAAAALYDQAAWASGALPLAIDSFVTQLAEDVDDDGDAMDESEIAKLFLLMARKPRHAVWHCRGVLVADEAVEGTLPGTRPAYFCERQDINFAVRDGRVVVHAAAGSGNSAGGAEVDGDDVGPAIVASLPSLTYLETVIDAFAHAMQRKLRERGAQKQEQNVGSVNKEEVDEGEDKDSGDTDEPCVIGVTTAYALIPAHPRPSLAAGRKQPAADIMTTGPSLMMWRRLDECARKAQGDEAFTTMQRHWLQTGRKTGFHWAGTWATTVTFTERDGFRTPAIPLFAGIDASKMALMDSEASKTRVLFPSHIGNIVCPEEGRGSLYPALYRYITYPVRRYRTTPRAAVQEETKEVRGDEEAVHAAVQEETKEVRGDEEAVHAAVQKETEEIRGDAEAVHAPFPRRQCRKTLRAAAQDDTIDLRDDEDGVHAPVATQGHDDAASKRARPENYLCGGGGGTCDMDRGSASNVCNGI